MTPLHVVVTGASGGIGEAIAANLLARGATVTAVARPGLKLSDAVQRLGSAFDPSRVVTLGADLSLLAEVRRAATLLRKHPVDRLILNAALMPAGRQLTADGLEQTLAVNHLAPYLLARLLLPTMLPGSRIVVVGADPGMLASEPVDLHDLGLERDFTPSRAYMRSKNMNAMFAYAMARHATAYGVTVNAAHPGIIRTSLGRNATGMMRLMLGVARPFLATAAKGADTPAWLAWSPDVANITGEFFVKRKSVKTAPHTLDRERQDLLWAASAALVALPA